MCVQVLKKTTEQADKNIEAVERETGRLIKETYQWVWLWDLAPPPHSVHSVHSYGGVHKDSPKTITLTLHHYHYTMKGDSGRG